MRQTLATCCLAAVLISVLIYSTSCHAKRTKSASPSSSCSNDECLLPKEHFEIYSNIKEATENGFDINVKDLVPFLRSIEILKRRYSASEPSNEEEAGRKKLVDALLINEAFLGAMKVFNSDDGRDLVDLYKSSFSGRNQNIACSQWQLDEIMRATKKLDSSKELANVFGKIHKNYVKKAAKKCLKHSCNSIDTSMSQLDSILRKSKRRSTREAYDDDMGLSNYIEDSDTTSGSDEKPISSAARCEFASEELELCRFFSRSNETDCRISGKELADVNLLGNNGTANGPMLMDYLHSYAKNWMKEPSAGKNGVEMAAKVVMDQCSPMRGLLDYNLAAFKWYNEKNVLDQQKLETRLVWCPNLSYWLQMDRLCNELERVRKEMIVY